MWVDISGDTVTPRTFELKVVDGKPRLIKGVQTITANGLAADSLMEAARQNLPVKIDGKIYWLKQGAQDLASGTVDFVIEPA